MESGQLATVIALVARGFIATNRDNLLLLVIQASTHRSLPVLVLLWAGLAYKIGENQALVRLIEQRGKGWVPWIMIVVGGYILFDTATDSL